MPQAQSLWQKKKGLFCFNAFEVLKTFNPVIDQCFINKGETNE